MSEAAEILSRVERVPYRGTLYVEAQHLDKALALLAGAEETVRTAERAIVMMRNGAPPAGPRDFTELEESMIRQAGRADNWEPHKVLVDETQVRLGWLDRLFRKLFGP